MSTVPSLNTDTPPQFPSDLPTPPHDPSPSTSVASSLPPIPPIPSTPPPRSPPRLSYDQKGKRNAETQADSRHPNRRRRNSISAPVLVLGAPMEDLPPDRDRTPPKDRDYNESPPFTPTRYQKKPITYSRRPSGSSLLLFRLTGSSYSPPVPARSPPPPTLSPPNRALTLSPGQGGGKGPLPSSSPLTLPKPPTAVFRNKLEHFSLPTRGVQVKSNDNVGKGETILRTTPLHGVLHSPLLETHCSGCFMSPEHKAKQMQLTLKAARLLFLGCTRCEVVTFCSMKCYAQTAHAHFDECRALGNVKAVPPADVRLIARVCWARAHGIPDGLPSFTAQKLHAKELLDLGDLVKDVGRFLAQVPSHAGRVSVDWKKVRLPGQTGLVSLIRRIRAATFEMSDWASIPTGLCVSPQIARLNHSCRPNAYVAFPFGSHVEDPMRVIAIDPRFGGEELTISYVDLGLPCHQRTEALAAFGFDHQCEWCQRLEVDERWSARHLNCDEHRIVPLRDTEYVDGEGRLIGQCCGCHKRVPVDVNSTGYPESMSRLEASWAAEREGVWLVDQGHYSAMSREIAVLTKEINKLLKGFPETQWPIAHLHRRLARLLLHLPHPRIKDINRAIDYLDTAHATMREWNNDEPRPITLALLVEKITAHSEAIKVVMTEVMGWKNNPVVAAHFHEVKETLETAKEDARELFGNDGAVLLDLVEGWGRRLERLEDLVVI